MIKTLTNILKQDKERFQVPKKVQDIIPVSTICPDGIFLSGKNKYSMTYKFEDINYAVASREDKEAMFLEYSELLNALDSGSTTKITINNRRLNRTDFEKQILIDMKDDGLNEYREEYNEMLMEKATGSNAIVQDKYVTISVNKKSIDDARVYFARVGADLIAHFSRLGSVCTELDAVERLRIIHDFMRTGEETSFQFDIKDHMRKGHSFKDYICPDDYENHSDYFKVGDRYGRVILLRDYASYIKDSMVAEVTDINRSMMLSIDVIPVPTDEAVKEVEQRLLGVETNILGVSGSGKSFTAKNEITNLILSTDADIIVVDPEREYAPLIKALGGSVIEISATSPNHINAMDMSSNYGETDPIIEKSQFLQSLCEQIIAGHKFAKGQQSIIDRCTENVYRYYKQGNYMGTPPTLADFRDELLKQKEPEARSLGSNALLIRQQRRRT